MPDREGRGKEEREKMNRLEKKNGKKKSTFIASSVSIIHKFFTFVKFQERVDKKMIFLVENPT